MLRRRHEHLTRRRREGEVVRLCGAGGERYVCGTCAQNVRQAGPGALELRRDRARGGIRGGRVLEALGQVRKHGVYGLGRHGRGRGVVQVDVAPRRGGAGRLGREGRGRLRCDRLLATMRNEKGTCRGRCPVRALEARPGFEPGIKALQASALPLGHLAI